MGLRTLRGRQKNAKTLAKILSFLQIGQTGRTYQSTLERDIPSDQQANHPDQLSTASSSMRTADSGHARHCASKG
jgi:hypothetical protein